MRWVEISVRVPPTSVEPVVAALTESGCGGAAVVDPAARSSDPFAWADPGPVGASADPRCTVTGYLPLDDRLEPALEEIRRRLRILQESGITVGDGLALRTLEEEAWAEAWKAHFKPLRVGRRFVVKPSWEPWNASPDERVLEIDPGMAFGTGTHPSTRLCLLLLEDAVRPGDRVLDWGTGSGILAVAGARLGASEVVAIDLDPAALRVAQANAERNGFSAIVRTALASIEALPPEPAFDLVTANLVADPIVAGAGQIRRRLRPGGRAIVSGIVATRSAEVVAALEAAGLHVRRSVHEEEWRAFLTAGDEDYN